MLIGARQKKKEDKLQEEQLAMQKRQNVFGNITGAVSGIAGLAKTGFDAYNTLKLQPERDAKSFEQAKELEGIKHENALTQDTQRIEYETWAKQFDANSSAALSKAGIDQDVWKTMYTTAAASSEADKSRILESELTRYGIDQTLARQLASQAFQTNERVASEGFQTAFAQLGSSLKKGELSYSSDLEAKAAEKANEYATALSGTNTKNAMQIAAAQSQLDLARDIALQGAKTEDQRELIELEYIKRSEENAQKFGYDVSLLTQQTESTKEIETVKNSLGLQRDTAGYDFQTRRDEILHGFDMAGKQFDATTQKEIIGMQTAAEQALTKAKADYDMVMALYQSGDAKESDVRLFEQQLKLAQTNHANTILQLEAEYGYKGNLQDDDQAARIEEIREQGAQNKALETLRGGNDLTIARVNATADLSKLQTNFNLDSEKDAMQAYSSPSDAILFKRTQMSEADASLGIQRTPKQIDADVARMILADAEYYKVKGWTNAEDVARRAYSQLMGSPASVDTKAGIGTVNLGVLGGNQNAGPPPVPYTSWEAYMQDVAAGKVKVPGITTPAQQGAVKLKGGAR